MPQPLHGIDGHIPRHWCQLDSRVLLHYPDGLHRERRARKVRLTILLMRFGLTWISSPDPRSRNQVVHLTKVYATTSLPENSRQVLTLRGSPHEENEAFSGDLVQGPPRSSVATPQT